jgi:hypothetical protein
MNKVKINEKNLIRSRALTVLFSMLISALLLLPLFTHAKGREKTTNPGKLYMQPLNKDYHATVTIANLAEGKYTLTIESGNGMNVYYNTLLESPENFSKVFDFSKLSDGDYTLRLDGKQGITERFFTISNGKIKVYYAEKEAPMFKTVGQKALFTLPNSLGLDYSIRIYNERGEELFHGVESANSIKKLFDFSQVEAGNYKILVSSKAREFSYNFSNQK